MVKLTDPDGIEEFWVNMVHTYGVASAQYYWGRTAAALLRLLYYVFGTELTYAYVFVGDFSTLLIVRENLMGAVTEIFLLLGLFGTPIAYHKTYLQADTTRVGFLIHLNTSLIDLPDEKKQDLGALAEGSRYQHRYGLTRWGSTCTR